MAKWPGKCTLDTLSFSKKLQPRRPKKNVWCTKRIQIPPQLRGIGVFFLKCKQFIKIEMTMGKNW